MLTLPLRTEAPHKGQEPTVEEMQEQLQEDWRNANIEGDILQRVCLVKNEVL